MKLSNIFLTAFSMTMGLSHVSGHGQTMKSSNVFPTVFFMMTMGLSYVSGHGQLISPRSRNWFAFEEGVDGAAVAGKPRTDYCYHCLNVNNGVCGVSTNYDYDLWLDSVGEPMEWNSQAVYLHEQEIEVVSRLETHHNGKFANMNHVSQKTKQATRIFVLTSSSFVQVTWSSKPVFWMTCLLVLVPPKNVSMPTMQPLSEMRAVMTCRLIPTILNEDTTAGDNRAIRISSPWCSNSPRVHMDPESCCNGDISRPTVAHLRDMLDTLQTTTFLVLTGHKV